MLIFYPYRLTVHGYHLMGTAVMNWTSCHLQAEFVGINFVIAHGCVYGGSDLWGVGSTAWNLVDFSTFPVIAQKLSLVPLYIRIEEKNMCECENWNLQTRSQESRFMHMC